MSKNKTTEILKLIRKTTRKDLIPLRNKGGVYDRFDMKTNEIVPK